MTGSVLPISSEPSHHSGSVYLDAYLAPFRPFLARESVTEILVNRPGEAWIEDAAAGGAGSGGGMVRVSLPGVDDTLLRRLAEQVARQSHQGINREHPLLAATLPAEAGLGATRIQLAGPPATRGHWAMAIRRHRLADLPLDTWDRGALVPRADPPMPDPLGAPIAYLKEAVRRRKTVLVSGGTSSGKTTFLNALLREIPPHERVVLVEDTAELKLPGDNGLGLIAVKGDQGEARVTPDDLLQAALRLRPDRIVLGELRGQETVSFLRAINTGHPGSFSTVHANSPQGALEQIALMAMQAKIGLTRHETIQYATSVIDIIVQLQRDENGGRIITGIQVAADLA